MKHGCFLRSGIPKAPCWFQAPLKFGQMAWMTWRKPHDLGNPCVYTYLSIYIYIYMYVYIYMYIYIYIYIWETNTYYRRVLWPQPRKWKWMWKTHLLFGNNGQLWSLPRNFWHFIPSLPILSLVMLCQAQGVFQTHHRVLTWRLHGMLQDRRSMESRGILKPSHLRFIPSWSTSSVLVGWPHFGAWTGKRGKHTHLHIESQHSEPKLAICHLSLAIGPATDPH